MKRLKVSDSKKVSREANKLDQEIDSKKARLSAIEQELVSGGGAVGALSRAAIAIENDLKILERRRKESVSTSHSEIQTLYGLRDDSKLFNVALRRVVDRIKVFHKGSSKWHVVIHQRNGHLISVSAYRKSQRSDWEYMFGNTAEMVAIADKAKSGLESWETDEESVDQEYWETEVINPSYEDIEEVWED